VRAVPFRPVLEGLESRWCPYASPNILWDGHQSTDWQDGRNFITPGGMRQAQNYQPGTGDVVGVAGGTLAHQPTIDGNIDTAKTIAGLVNNDMVNYHQFQLTIINNGSLTLNPSMAKGLTDSALAYGGGFSWIKLGSGSSLNLNARSTFTLEVASLVEVSSASIGTVYVSSTFYDYPSGGDNNMSCNVVVYNLGLFEMKAASSHSTLWSDSNVLMQTQPGGIIQFDAWTTATGIGFKDINVTGSSPSITNAGKIVFESGGSLHTILEQLPILSTSGEVDFLENTYVSLTNSRSGAATYDLDAVGTSPLVYFVRSANVTLTYPLEVEGGNIEFNSNIAGPGTITITGGLNVYGGTMTVGTVNINQLETVNVDNLTIGAATLHIYINHTSGSYNQVAVSGTLNVGRPNQNPKDNPTLDVETVDGSPPDLGGTWTVMIYNTAKRHLNSGKTGTDAGDFALAWVGSGHNFSGGLYVVSN
jgi:hypothetical protein